MKKEFRNFLAFVFVCSSIVSCDRTDKIDTQSPAYQIAQSEKLSIPDAVSLPANAPAGNMRVATYYAIGVQKYKAQQKANAEPGVFEWVFVAPQADLYDATGKKVGTHSAGPTWQLIGSTADSIYAQAFTPARNAPAPVATSIDWLLLKPKDGKAPTGFFANVSYIQRIDTRGGKAPQTPPANASATVEIPYTAIYRFSKKNQ